MSSDKRILADWSRGVFAGMRLYENRYEPGTWMPSHSHATASVSLVVIGAFAERIDGARRQSGGLSVIVKPSGVVHETRCGPEACRTISLQLPSRLELELHRRHGAFARIAHDDEAPLTAALVRLWSRALEVDLARDEQWMARWWREAAPGLERDAERRTDRRLEAALAVSAEGGGAAEAADAIGVHPVHLCRLFRAATGRGTAENFRRARVRRATDELAKGASLAGAAAACGFSDQSHMTRAFVRETGATPGALRVLLADRV